MQERNRANLHQKENDMPYKSDQQRKWAHSPSGMKALGAKKVKEFDQASKGKDLPKRVKQVAYSHLPGSESGEEWASLKKAQPRLGARR